MITPSRLMIFLTLVEFACSIVHAYNHDIPWLFASVIFTLVGGFMAVLFLNAEL